MLRLTAVLSVLLLSPLMASAQSIEGVWRIVERETVGGPNAGVLSESEIQPGFIIYTDGGHFASVGVLGAEPRPMSSGDASDAEIAAAALRYYGRIATYEVSGSTITYQRIVDLNANPLCQLT